MEASRKLPEAPWMLSSATNEAHRMQIYEYGSFLDPQLHFKKDLLLFMRDYWQNKLNCLFHRTTHNQEHNAVIDIDQARYYQQRVQFSERLLRSQWHYQTLAKD